MLQRPLKIYVTDIPTFLFCQMSYFFTKFRYPTQNKTIQDKMNQGKKDHSELFNHYYRKSSYYGSFNNTVLQTLKDGITKKLRENLPISLITARYTITGRIDEVKIEPDRILIIDDKGTDSLSPFQRIMYQQQVELYSELFTRQYLPFLEVHYAVRQSKTDFFFFEHKFTQLSFDLDSTIALLLDYWNGNLTLLQTTNPSKCRECRFFDTDVELCLYNK